MSQSDLVIVIMAGGAGKRFWPLSTERCPKQFLALFGDRSLLRMCYERIAGLVPPERVLALTSHSHVGIVARQLPELARENVIGEPVRRDTAAAVSLAAFVCKRRFGNPVIATLTADHLITPADRFTKTLLSAVRAAEKGEALYTLGVKPASPSTAYGYLERGPLAFDDDGIRHYTLNGFREKPDIETARQYVESGRYFWNSGMFVWRTDTIIEQIRTHLPGHAKALEPVGAAWGTGRWKPSLKKTFARLDTISIDYGVMERAPAVMCAEADFSWNDVGGWNALEDILPADDAENASRGTLVTLDSRGNLVYCENPDETVMTIGISDLVIVRAGKRTLVAHRDRVEDIKRLVDDHPDL